MDETICQPHLERSRTRIRASHVVGGVPMCKRCYEGKSIFPFEDAGTSFRMKSVHRGRVERPRKYFARTKKLAMRNELEAAN